MNILISELENTLRSKVINIHTLASIDGISIDSRTINKNELFIAIKGDSHDGHLFINDAIKSNRIEVVYIIDASPKGGIQFNHFKNYLTDDCFESKDIIEEVVSSHKLVNCK